MISFVFLGQLTHPLSIVCMLACVVVHRLSPANVVLELTNCAAGRYVSGAFVCAACAAGTYSTAPGASACVACGAGLVADVNSISCVVACPSGQYNNGGAHCFGFQVVDSTLMSSIRASLFYS
jgi:hypothetical protein